MTPYISAVITGRNDGYGENFLLRVNTFIKSLDHQVKNYPNLFEIILVEWNPPADTPSMAEVIYKPKNLELRIITVPKEVHDTYNAQTPMLEYAAKNVGIFRARGDFVLTTNPDIIFTDFLIHTLSKRALQHDVVYRTDRYDYKGDSIEHIDPSMYMNYAVRNTFCAQLLTDNRSVTYEVSEAQRVSLFVLPSSTSIGVPHTNACGDFILASREKFINSGGLWEKNQVDVQEIREDGITYTTTKIISSHYDSISLLSLFRHGLKQVVFTAPLCIFHMDHARQPIKDSFNFKFIYQLLESSSNNTFAGQPDKEFHEITLMEPTMFTGMNIFDFMTRQTMFGRGDSDQHTLTLFGIALALRPKAMLELGVRQGMTTLPLLYAAKLSTAVLHSVDIEMTTFNCPEELSLNWVFFKSDAIAYLEAAVARNEKYDLIYIDDWHSYDHVKRELELIDKITTPESVIILHDLMYSNYQPNYHCNINDPDPQWANGGPYRAVAELPNNVWEYVTIPVNHGLTILRKKGLVLS
jgi:predicted O-methyltransferase YrrM